MKVVEVSPISLLVLYTHLFNSASGTTRGARLAAPFLVTQTEQRKLISKFSTRYNLFSSGSSIDNYYLSSQLQRLVEHSVSSQAMSDPHPIMEPRSAYLSRLSALQWQADPQYFTSLNLFHDNQLFQNQDQSLVPAASTCRRSSS